MMVIMIKIQFGVMKNKQRNRQHSVGKQANLSKSKSKQKSKSKKYQCHTPYASSKNSLSIGSPRNPKQIDKYKKYVQFLAANKRSLDPISLPSDRDLPKKKSQTPKHKRNSSDPFFRNKKSNILRYDQSFSPKNLYLTQRNSLPINSIIQRIKSPRISGLDYQKSIKRGSKQKSMYGTIQSVLKKSIRKKKSKQKAKKDNQNHIQQHSTANKTSIESSNINTSKLDKQEQKLREKLFKDIQFYRDLGKGSHAIVKSAVDWTNKRKIAIKIYNKENVKEEQLKSIEREIQILNQIDHPRIIKLYEIIETFKTINLVMEYGGGNSLSNFLKSKENGCLSEGEAKQIFKQILECVDYLQQKNIAHRDLKAQNILLNKHLNLKLIDFGFSLKCNSGLHQSIHTYCGTPTYMAPQIVCKIPHNPLLSDRWSLGILLFVLLNGRCPFRATSQKQLFSKIVSGQYVYFSPVSAQAKDLIARLLIHDPIQRISPSESLKHLWFQK